MDHLLLIGFGGPTRREEVRPFLEGVAKGRGIPPNRLKRVEDQYERIGGFSPYNDLSGRLVKKLTSRLKELGKDLPVYLGMRQWRPFLAETLAEIRRNGGRRGLAVILAPHRSEASYSRYIVALEEARSQAAPELTYELRAPWHDHPLFIEAQAQRVRDLWREGGGEQARLVFTAHSIPVEMARASRYKEELQASCRSVAERLGVSDWELAYQSRSGAAGQPWLEPDALSRIPVWKKEGIRQITAVPIGFLFDHTEVLYDLDIQLREAAEREGLVFRRAETVMDHPSFVEMLAEGVQSR